MEFRVPDVHNSGHTCRKHHPAVAACGFLGFGCILLMRTKTTKHQSDMKTKARILSSGSRGEGVWRLGDAVFGTRRLPSAACQSNLAARQVATASIAPQYVASRRFSRWYLRELEGLLDQNPMPTLTLFCANKESKKGP